MAASGNIERIFRPFLVLSPHSITATCAATGGRFPESAMYRALVILSLASTTALAWHRLLTSQNQTYIPFNTNGFVFAYWTLDTVFNVYLISTLGKRRVRKLMREIRQLDEELFFNDEASTKQMVWLSVSWMAYITIFHAGASIAFICLFVDFTRADAERVLLMFWLACVDIRMVVEVACFFCFTVLLYTRLKHFVRYLNSSLSGRRPDERLSVTACYRQLHRVLSKIEKSFHVQVAIIIGVFLFSALRIVLTFNSMEDSLWTSSVNAVMLSRYMVPLAGLGALGQAAGAQLRRLRLLAALMQHSGDAKLQSIGARLTAEAAARVSGPRALGRVLDARLPLRAGAALLAAAVLLLQLGVDVVAD